MTTTANLAPQFSLLASCGASLRLEEAGPVVEKANPRLRLLASCGGSLRLEEAGPGIYKANHICILIQSTTAPNKTHLIKYCLGLHIKSNSIEHGHREVLGSRRDILNAALVQEFHDSHPNLPEPSRIISDSPDCPSTELLLV